MYTNQFQAIHEAKLLYIVVHDLSYFLNKYLIIRKYTPLRKHISNHPSLPNIIEWFSLYYCNFRVFIAIPILKTHNSL